MKRFISLIIFGLVMMASFTITGAIVEPDNPQYTVSSALTGYDVPATVAVATEAPANSPIFQYANLQADDPQPLPVDPQKPGFWDLFSGYWAELLLGIMAVVKILVRITPTLKDDKVFGWLDKLIEYIIPNFERK